MKTSIQYMNLAQTITFIYFLLFSLNLAHASPSTTAGINDVYQYNALFKPSENQLKAEARGHVLIYDGLSQKTIERALDEQFDRIENMMFIRIHKTVAGDGEDSVEDDGC